MGSALSASWTGGRDRFLAYSILVLAGSGRFSVGKRQIFCLDRSYGFVLFILEVNSESVGALLAELPSVQ